MARDIYDEVKKELENEGYNSDALEGLIALYAINVAQEQYGVVAAGLISEDKFDEFRNSVLNAVKEEIEKKYYFYVKKRPMLVALVKRMKLYFRS